MNTGTWIALYAVLAAVFTYMAAHRVFFRESFIQETVEALGDSGVWMSESDKAESREVVEEYIALTVPLYIAVAAIFWLALAYLLIKGM